MSENLNVCGLSGLNNRGNTCFMNTALQILSNTIPLTNYIMNGEYMNPLRDPERINYIQTNLVKEFDITKTYINLVRALWSGNEPLDPRSFHKALQTYKAQFAGYQQQDAEEALITIMDSIHEVLKYKVDINITGNIENNVDTLMREAYLNWKNTNEKGYSIITKTFTGQTMEQIISKDQSDMDTELSRKYDNFNILNIPINGNTLYDCFKHYFNVEELQDLYHHEKTDRKVKVGKSIKLMLLPKYLVVCLKRFDNSTGMIRKNTTMVSFPIENLDLHNHTLGYDKYDAKYRLRSIGCHIGSYSGGHYYAIVRHRNGNWYEYNDTNCTPYNIKSEVPMLQSKAYILVYEKKESR